MANLTERNGLRAFNQCSHFHFWFFFSLSCFYFVLFCFSFLLIFQADTSLFFFHLIAENLILHIFLIIMIIIRCSGMFRNFPGCSMFQILSTPIFKLRSVILYWWFEPISKSEMTKVWRPCKMIKTKEACYKSLSTCHPFWER